MCVCANIMTMRNQNMILHVDGMMCQNNCGTTVLNALRAVRGVQEVVVSFLSESAIVTLEQELVEVRCIALFL